MNTKKLFGGKIAIAIAIIIVLLVVVSRRDANETAEQTASASGKVVSVDSSQIIFDGPHVITIQTVDGTSVVNVPSMGLLLCAAHENKNLADVSTIKAGDTVEVRGALGEDGSIVPCDSADHYLRVTAKAVAAVDISKITLDSKTWTWVSAQYNDGRVVTPRAGKTFTLTFTNDGEFSAKTDCNSVGGSYAVDANKTLSFLHIFSTKMFCEGSQESDFIRMLETTGSYHYSPSGELILDLKFDSGSVVFR